MDDHNEVGLKNLVVKLGHHLLDVRKRSLRNLQSKLENGIISLENLLHYKDLYPNLLEWLNRHEDEQNVIQLLTALTNKFPYACRTLIELGGIEFFVQYKQDLLVRNATELVETVENILDCLYHLHSGTSHGPINFSSTQKTIHDTDLSSTATHNVESVDINEPHQQRYVVTHAKNGSIAANIEVDVKVSNTDGHSSTSKQLSFVQNVSTSSKDFFRHQFQWLPLTSGDRQILAVTESRLQSSSTDLIMQSCNFLKNVLLHDFPAEVFIQRPNIVKTLLCVLSVNKSRHSDWIMSILQSLCDICKKLHQRISQNQNIDMWQTESMHGDIQSTSVSTNQTQSSSLSCNIKNSPPEKPSANNIQSQSNASPNNVNLQSDIEDIESSIMTDALYQSQLPLERFLIDVLLSTIDLLKLYLHHNSMFMAAAKLHKHVLDLLQLVNMKVLWDSSSNNAIINTEITILSSFSEVCYVFITDRKTTNDEDEEIELKAVIVCKILIAFLESCVPNDRLYEVVPSDVLRFLKWSLNKVTFTEELYDLRNSLEIILNSLDEKYIKEYNEALRIIASMRRIDEFFGLFNSSQPIADYVIIELAEEILPSLYFHAHEEFIRKVLYACCERHVNKLNNKKWTGLFVDVVTHAEVNVKKKVYIILLEILKDAFSESVVSHPLSTKHQKAWLLVQENIVQQIARDCQCECEQVRNLCTNIACILLTSQLYMSPSMWDTVMKSITSSLVVLQSNIGCSRDNAFNSSMFSIINQRKGVLNVDGDLTGLPRLEHLRTVLRLLYHRLDTVRSKGFALAIVQLTDYDKRNKNVVSYSYILNDSDVASPPVENLLVFNARDLIGFQNTVCRFDCITEENVNKLWKVFNDELVEERLRYSAAEQLSVIFQDPSFHQILIRDDNYKLIMAKFSSCMHTKSIKMRIAPNTIHKKFLISLVKILKHLTHSQPAVRHILSSNADFYLQLLQACLLFSKDYELRFYASSLLSLLLFDDIISTLDGRTNKSLAIPQCVKKNFRLAIDFQVAIETSQSIKYDDVVKSEYLKDFVFQKCWSQMKWYQNDVLHAQCSEHLQLSVELKQKYTTLNANNIVRRMSRTCIKPTNHIEAMKVLHQLSLVFFVFHHHPQLAGEPNKKSDILDMLSTILNDGFVKRIITVYPASDEDHKLFSTAIEFTETIIELNYVETFDLNIEESLLSSVATRMIQNIHSEQRSNAIEWNRLLKQLVVTAISSLLRFNQRLVTSSSQPHTSGVSLSKAYNENEANRRICGIVEAIYKTLSITGSESYYDLPLMEFMLECLMHLLARPKWSEHVEAQDGGRAFCTELFSWFAQILVSFHVDRVSAAVSFMGKGIVHKSAVCLCHVIHELKLFDDEGRCMEQCVIGNNSAMTSAYDSLPTTSTLQWLIPLLSDRMSNIRYCGWAISTALLVDKAGRQSVIDEFQNLPGGLWAVSLGVVLDEKECFAVRSQAATLLTKLVQMKGTPEPSSSVGGETLWKSIIVQDTSSKMEVNGVDAFLLLLEHFEFFGELRLIFTPAPSASNTWSNAAGTKAQKTLINASTSFSNTSASFPVSQQETIEKNSTSHSTTSLLSSSNQSNGVRSAHMIDRDYTAAMKLPNSTPMFKKSLLQLICKLIELSPASILESLNKRQLVDIILRSWMIDDNSESGNVSPTRSSYQNSSIDVTCSILHFLNLLYVYNIEQYCDVIERHDVMGRLFDMLIDRPKSDAISSQQLLLWKHCLMILGKMHSLKNVKMTETFRGLTKKNLPALCDQLTFLLSKIKQKATVPILTLFLKLMLLILKDIAHNNLYEIDSLTVLSEEGHVGEENATPTIGERVFKDLVTLYEKMFLLKTPLLLRNLFQCLFVCSVSAKERALCDGFVESVIEELKDKLVRLNMITAFEKAEEEKSEKDALLKELCSILDVILNFMFRCEKVKLAFLQAKLLVHLQNVWRWSHLHNELRMTSLNLMTVFSANCTDVCAALCSASNLSFKQTIDESSFLSYVIKLLIRYHNEATLVHGKFNQCLKSLFELLTNILTVSEGRCCFYKANVVQLFLQVFTLTKSGNKNQRINAKSLQCSWLRLYTVLSFHTDGAKFIAKISGVTRVFLSIVHESPAAQKNCACVLLIFRNLMFVQASKQMLSSNKEVTNCMLEILGGSGNCLKLKAAALSFFSIMLYDNIKGKGVANKMGLHKKLSSLRDDLQTGKALSKDGDLKSYQQLVTMVSNTFKLLQG